MIKNFLIDNCVVSKMYDNGIRIMSINFMKKQYPKMDISDFPRIDTGNKLSNHRLITELSDEGLTKFNELVEIYL